MPPAGSSPEPVKPHTRSVPSSLFEQARLELIGLEAVLVRLTIQDLEGSGAKLERAAALMTSGVEALSRAPQEPVDAEKSRAALDGFRREWKRVRALYENGRHLEMGWMQQLARLSGAGYSVHGEPLWPALETPGRRISLEG